MHFTQLENETIEIDVMQSVLPLFLNTFF